MFRLEALVGKEEVNIRTRESRDSKPTILEAEGTFICVKDV